MNMTNDTFFQIKPMYDSNEKQKTVISNFVIKKIRREKMNLEFKKAS